MIPFFSVYDLVFIRKQMNQTLLFLCFGLPVSRVIPGAYKAVAGLLQVDGVAGGVVPFAEAIIGKIEAGSVVQTGEIDAVELNVGSYIQNCTRYTKSGVKPSWYCVLIVFSPWK